MKMEEISIPKRIEIIIKRNPKSKVYSAFSFSTLESYDNVRQALSRLERSGKLIRVARGFYKPAEYSNFIREQVAVDPTEVAKAYAKAYQLTIAPYGDTALNILGLSTQVPNVYQFISDGSYKTITLEDGRKIEFKHRTIREISGLSFKEAALIESIKVLGQNRLTSKTKNALLRKFSRNELAKIKNKKSRKWIYKEISNLLEMSK